MNRFDIGLISGTLLGILIMILVNRRSCTEAVVDPHRSVDTVTIVLNAPVPNPVIVYRTKLDTIVKYQQWVEYRNQIDTIFRDSAASEIPVNRYVDAIDQDSVRLDYTIETLGFLTKFDPRLTIKRKIEYIPYRRHWMAGAGVSSKANWKGSIGYDGWTIECELTKGYKFNQLYIGKQFYF